LIAINISVGIFQLYCNAVQLENSNTNIYGYQAFILRDLKG